MIARSFTALLLLGVVASKDSHDHDHHHDHDHDSYEMPAQAFKGAEQIKAMDNETLVASTSGSTGYLLTSHGEEQEMIKTVSFTVTLAEEIPEGASIYWWATYALPGDLLAGYRFQYTKNAGPDSWKWQVYGAAGTVDDIPTVNTQIVPEIAAPLTLQLTDTFTTGDESLTVEPADMADKSYHMVIAETTAEAKVVSVEVNKDAPAIELELLKTAGLTVDATLGIFVDRPNATSLGSSGPVQFIFTAVEEGASALTIASSLAALAALTLF